MIFIAIGGASLGILVLALVLYRYQEQQKRLSAPETPLDAVCLLLDSAKENWTITQGANEYGEVLAFLQHANGTLVTLTQRPNVWVRNILSVPVIRWRDLNPFQERQLLKAINKAQARAMLVSTSKQIEVCSGSTDCTLPNGHFGPHKAKPGRSSEAPKDLKQMLDEDSV